MTNDIKELENKPAGRFYAQGAAIDAKNRDKNNIDNFPENLREFGQDLYQRAMSVFYRSKCYLNYRTKFIAIKVDHPSKLDELSSEYEDFMKFIKEQTNCTIVQTPSALIVRVAV